MIGLVSKNVRGLFSKPSSTRSVSCRANMLRRKKMRCYTAFSEEANANEPVEYEIDHQILPPLEKARSLLESRKSGTLGTVTLEENQGTPLFGSMMPYVLLNNWLPANPVIALRKDEKHYSNIRQGENVSMLIYPLTPKRIVPANLPLSRMNIIASPNEVTDLGKIDSIIEKFAVVHPGSEKFLREQQDIFAYYYLQPLDIYYLNVTSEMIQFRGSEFCRAPIDPIMKDGREFLDYLNENYTEELRIMCRLYGDVEVEDAFVFSVDRRGFDILGLVANTNNQWYEFRMPLDREIVDEVEYQKKVVTACKEVRKQEQ